MSNFPIYETLIKEIKNCDLTVKQKNDFMNKIQKLDEVGTEVCYVLIRVFEINHEDVSSTFKLPYNGKFIESDISFDLEKLPIKLRQLLYKFVSMHCEKIEEESNKLVSSFFI
jgi:hypothetical protein